VRSNPEPWSASYREIFGYGFRVYGGSLTTFFSYRVDAYLIAGLLADPSEPLGYYSMAVGLAEMVFFFPNAVATLFFPHIASLPREDADRQVPMVARVTLLITTAFALIMVPGAIVMILILLPAFEPSILPFLILLPGVVALSVAKVVGGYIGGIGRPGVNSWVSIVSLAVNVAANLVLIPPFGIVGAAAASLASYSFSALLITAIAARATGSSVAGFWVPRPADFRFAIATTASLLRRIRRRRPTVSGEATG
jgi:O-antigen/teichoic acid export membrane protein